MTSFTFTDAQLKEEILKENPNWFSKAETLTQRFRNQGSYSGDENLWSSVKKAWIRLQRQKCAYCECKYGNEEYASINYDVEHYRPKSAVKAWPAPADVKENPNLAYGFATGGPSSKGYYLMAYNVANYAVACKECNTIFKSSSFPIEAERHVDAEDFATLKSELPLLLFPIGAAGDDAATFLNFEGIVPIPAQNTGAAFRRARVTIDFFKLAYREELLRERCFMLCSLYFALEQEGSPIPVASTVAKNTLTWLRSNDPPHSSCIRDFEALYQSNRELAERIVLGASELLANAAYAGMGFRDIVKESP